MTKEQKKKELAIIYKIVLLNFENVITGGLCAAIRSLYDTKVLTFEQYCLVSKDFVVTKPKWYNHGWKFWWTSKNLRRKRAFWWEEGEVPIRKKYLQYQIKRNSSSNSVPDGIIYMSIAIGIAILAAGYKYWMTLNLLL